MILRTAGLENRLTLELTGARQFRFRSAYPCDLEPEALIYAVCRLIAHTPALLNPLAAESCRLRFEHGKARRPVRRRITASAMLLELPGVWAAADLLIGPQAITVTGLTLSETLPVPSSPANRRPRIGVLRCGDPSDAGRKSEANPQTPKQGRPAKPRAAL